MNYDEGLEYINSTKRYNAKLNLDRVESFMKELGNPEKAMKYVHIAGTNGKGSATAMMGAILTEAGYNTGMFISPYLERFNERIQLQGEPIPDDELANLITRVSVVAEAMEDKGLIHPSFFEFIMGMAFQYWKEKKCDFVSLEVGLGGRLDATNVIEAPEVAIIASISFDHTHLLGNTLAEIAQEKCGIIKKGSSVVCYADQPEEAREVIERTCRERGADFIMPDKNSVEILETGLFGSKIRYKHIETTVPLMGYHQVLNAIGVIEAGLALKRRGFHVDESHIAAGIANTKWVGRLEIVKQDPLTIIDAAHNPDAIKVLYNAIDNLLAGHEIVSVMGMLADKDYAVCIPEIAKRSKTFIAVTPTGGRALEAAETAQIAKQYCNDVILSDDIPDACRKAMRLGAGKTVLICGSLHVIGEAKTIIKSM